MSGGVDIHEVDEHGNAIEEEDDKGSDIHESEQNEILVEHEKDEEQLEPQAQFSDTIIS